MISSWSNSLQNSIWKELWRESTISETQKKFVLLKIRFYLIFTAFHLLETLFANFLKLTWKNIIFYLFCLLWCFLFLNVYWACIVTFSSAKYILEILSQTQTLSICTFLSRSILTKTLKRYTLFRSFHISFPKADWFQWVTSAN